MAFLATNQIPSEGYARAKRIAVDLKAYAQGLAAKWAASNTSRREVLATWEALHSYRAALSDIASIPGIGEFAAAQEDVPNYDVAAEFSAMLAAISAVTTKIQQVFPASNGYLLVDQFGSGQITGGVFTVAEINAAGIITLLQSLAASVG